MFRGRSQAGVCVPGGSTVTALSCHLGSGVWNWVLGRNDAASVREELVQHGQEADTLCSQVRDPRRLPAEASHRPAPPRRGPGESGPGGQRSDGKTPQNSALAGSGSRLVCTGTAGKQHLHVVIAPSYQPGKRRRRREPPRSSGQKAGRRPLRIARPQDRRTVLGGADLCLEVRKVLGS